MYNQNNYNEDQKVLQGSELSWFFCKKEGNFHEDCQVWKNILGKRNQEFET